MLTISNLSYKIGGRTILDDVSVNIQDGWKVGVIGLNGAGKSTLFKLITGDLHPDGGEVSMNISQRMGQVKQDIAETDTPLLDMVLAAHTEMAQLWHDAEHEPDPNKLGDIYARLGELDAYSAPSKAAQLLTGLGFKESQLQEPFSSFSGGWRMRVALAAALFVEPEVLLLDEPTNHLDLEAIMWLETYLSSYPHTLLVISHDRDMLNKCIDHVVHVDKQKLTLYTGNYDTFERERASRLGLQAKMHEKQQAQRAHMQSFIDRFKAKASKARQAQSRVKALEKMDLVDAVIADRAVRFNFPAPDSKIGSPMISINHADIGYMADMPILRKVYETIDPDDRIALLGANGNGKSTLIKLIAGELEALKGDVVRGAKLRIGYFSQHQTDQLDVNSTPFSEMRILMSKKNPNVAEHVVRAALGTFNFSKELADNKISQLSGGEKARLLFAFMSFDGPHLLILDEPTNHLDIDAREALVQALNNYEGAVLIVSHDPTMVERVADRLWLVKDGAVHPFDGDLEDYRKFTVNAKKEEKQKEQRAKAKSRRSSESEGGKKANAGDAASAITAADAEAHQIAAANENTARDVGNYNAKTAGQGAVKKKTNPRELERMEKDIAQLTADKAKLEAQMASPDFYTDTKRLAETQKTYAALLKDLEAKEAAWLEASS